MNFTTYLLLETPGWILASLILVSLWQWFGLPGWMSVSVFVVWVAKDLALYPFIRRTLNARIQSGSSVMIGKRGVVRETLDPKGYIQVGGELWQAEASAGERSIPPGKTVRVREARGLTLVVEESEEPERS